jgi:hypothetical protein
MTSNHSANEPHRKRILWKIVVWIAAINCISFVIISMAIGTASSGKVENGRYYLGLAKHERYTEVPRLAFELSELHFDSFLICLMVLFFKLRLKRQRKLELQLKEKERHELFNEIRHRRPNPDKDAEQSTSETQVDIKTIACACGKNNPSQAKFCNACGSPVR